MASIRDGFSQGLVQAAQSDARVVGLCADLTESIRMNAFAEQFPDRFWQVGVAEQNMIGLAAGLALAGKVPFAGSYAVFSPGRTWDQIRVSVCYSHLNVKIIGGHAGLNVGPDGAVHQALEDLAITRVLPRMTVVVPCDQEEARKATLAIAQHVGPSYLRLARINSDEITTSESPFTIGQANTLREGSDITLFACGLMVKLALQTAEALATQGVSARVVNMHTIKPLDTAVIDRAARETGAIVTLEEHQVTGGLGSAVCEWVSSHHTVPVLRLGVEDTFGESGSDQELWQKYGLTVEHALQLAQQSIALKKNHT